MKYMLPSVKRNKMNQETSQALNKGSQNMFMPPKYLQHFALKKTKRFRSAFSTEQVNYLETEFKKFPYIGSANRKELALKLKITERAVKIWFQNRRMREKKDGSSKEFDTDDRGKDISEFTNESLSNVGKLTLNNEQRCCSGELTRPSTNNLTNELITKTTNCNIKINQTLGSYNQEKPKGYVKTTMNNLAKQDSVISKYFANKVPVSIRKVNNGAKRLSSDMLKEKNVSVSLKKHQEKFSPSFCSSGKRLLNVDQDKAQDLSSRSQLHTQQAHFYPISPMPSSNFLPFPHPTYPPSSLQPGNIIWKPMPPLGTLATPITMTIPQPSTGSHIGAENTLKDCRCSCNCLGLPIPTFNEVSRSAYPQYILAIPISNSTK